MIIIIQICKFDSSTCWRDETKAARRRLEVRIGIHSPMRGEPHLVQPHDWGNIWVYGLSILLTGYLTHEEFCRRASLLPVGSRVFHTKNLSVPITEL